MRIYTRRGDDGTTSLRVGGRVRKDDRAIELLGTVDELQASLGLARAETERGEWLDELLVRLERDLWVLMAEVATARGRRSGLEPGVTEVSTAMVEALEAEIDRVVAGLDLESSFAVPGETRRSAVLDVARAVARRAERVAVPLGLEDSLVGVYLNRLSDLCWVLARNEEGHHPVQRRAPRGKPS